jgi:ubiquinone/menaquinone biosynthesis C-methylase UbiE
VRGVTVFDERAEEYDLWFEENKLILRAEINALRPFVPQTGTGLEIGVGTGRFAASLGVEVGIDPARRTLQFARARGIKVCQAFGEYLPFQASHFDYALLVTVDPFVPDVRCLLKEMRRVLKPTSILILGMIDKSSPLGQMYEVHKEEDPFYQVAHFHTTEEVITYLKQTGFEVLQVRQTITGIPDTTAITEQVEEGYAVDAFQIQEGHGEGAFVALKAEKKKAKSISN